VWLKLLKERSDKEEWHVYRTAEKGELPTVDDDYHGVIIPGSSHSCYEDLVWIHRLKDYIRACFIPLKADHHSMEHSKKPQIVGSCFGCQLIAETLGGYVTKNPRGRYIVQVRVALCAGVGSGPTAVECASCRDELRRIRCAAMSVGAMVHACELESTVLMRGCRLRRFSSRNPSRDSPSRRASF